MQDRIRRLPGVEGVAQTTSTSGGPMSVTALRVQGIAEVAGRQEHFRPFGFAQLAGLLRVVVLAEIGNRDPGALPGAQHRDRAAAAAAGAGASTGTGSGAQAAAA